MQHHWINKIDNLEVLLTADQIKHKVNILAEKINRDYKDKDLMVIMLYNGSFMFAADLLRKIELPITTYGLHVSSYVGKESTGNVKYDNAQIPRCIGKHVLLIEDIVEGGHTVNTIKQEIIKRGCETVTVCSLLDKPCKRKIPVEVEYVGLVVSDIFIVGYGLDYNHQYRQLPFIGYIK